MCWKDTMKTLIDCLIHSSKLFQILPFFASLYSDCLNIVSLTPVWSTVPGDGGTVACPK